MGIAAILIAALYQPVEYPKDKRIVLMGLYNSIFQTLTNMGLTVVAEVTPVLIDAVLGRQATAT